MIVSRRVADRITRDFPGDAAAQAMDLLAGLPVGHSTPEAAERICGALLILADGDLDRLVDAAVVAERDWRDVLVGAGLADEDWRARLDAALR